MRKTFMTLVTAAMLTLPATSSIGADGTTSPGATDRAEQALREGADKVLRALEMMMQAIPQYQMPEVLENGDIIIRRRNPEEPNPPPNSNDGPVGTST